MPASKHVTNKLSYTIYNLSFNKANNMETDIATKVPRHVFRTIPLRAIIPFNHFAVAERKVSENSLSVYIDA